MASTALAYRWPEPEEIAPAKVAPPSPSFGTSPSGAPSWHQLQAERLTTAFAQPQPTQRRLPLGLRVAVIASSALFGWSVPIAIATSLVR